MHKIFSYTCMYFYPIIDYLGKQKMSVISILILSIGFEIQ